MQASEIIHTLRFVDHINTKGFENLRLSKMANPCLGHNRNCNSSYDFFDELYNYSKTTFYLNQSIFILKSQYKNNHHVLYNNGSFYTNVIYLITGILQKVIMILYQVII